MTDNTLPAEYADFLAQLEPDLKADRIRRANARQENFYGDRREWFAHNKADHEKIVNLLASFLTNWVEGNTTLNIIGTSNPVRFGPIIIRYAPGGRFGPFFYASSRHGKNANLWKGTQADVAEYAFSDAFTFVNAIDMIAADEPDLIAAKQAKIAARNAAANPAPAAPPQPDPKTTLIATLDAYESGTATYNDLSAAIDLFVSVANQARTAQEA